MTKPTGRRGFLKTVALAGGAAAQTPTRTTAPPPPKPVTLPRSSMRCPRVYTGRQLAMLAMPLGGIAAGSISLGGRGQLRDWEIFSRPVGIVYNTFPWPETSDQQRVKIRLLAQTVLDARAQFPNSTLADLYDVDALPPQLRKAHPALCNAVGKLYSSAAFAGDHDRAEHLFGLYEKLVAPLVAATVQPSCRPRRRT